MIILRRSIGVVACSLLLLLSTSCSSSSDEPAPTPTGNTGFTIEGTVREAITGNPISGAQVVVLSGASTPEERTTTDSDGRFVLAGLVPGRFAIAASHEGYVSTNRLDGSGQTYRITEQGGVRGAVFSLVPAGSLAGRVIKPDGQPAPKVEIQLLQNHYVMGNLQLRVITPEGFNGRIETNHEGEFRVVGVDPGDYWIRLNPREPTAENIIPGGRPPVPALYPGVRDLAQARTVTVSPGRETRLEVVQLVAERREWIRVFVVNRTGGTLEGFGSWSLEPAVWVGSGFPRVQQRIVNNAHEFLPDLPGTYEIAAFWRTERGPLVGRIQVTYTGARIEKQMIVEKGTGALSGTVWIEEQPGAARKPVPGVEVSIGPDIPYVAQTQQDGGFAVPEVYSGRYKFADVRGIPAGAYIMSVMQGDRDVLREDLVIGNTPTSLNIVIGTGGGTASGLVKNAAGEPLQNARVVLVPESPLLERSDYYGAYASGRTDQTGGFEIPGLTPGSYQAYAWESIPPSAFRNAEFMKRFAGKGVPLKIEVSVTATLDLTSLGRADPK